jgi:outer membrane protein assembly factor BamB
VNARRAWLAAPFVALAVFMAGCTGSTGPKPAKLTDFKPKATLKVAWKSSVGDSGRYIFSPGIWDGDFFAAGADGRLIRLDARNGRARWKIDTKAKLSGGVEAFDGIVVLASTKGGVLAFDANGKRKWQAQVSSEVLSAPSISEGVVVVRSGDGRVHGLDVADGNRRWEYIATLPPLLIRTSAGVAIEKGVVYAGLPGGKMIALNLSTGALLWEASVSQPRGETELERVTDVVSVPVVENGHVCAVAFQGRIACFETQRGTLSWARNASGTGGLAADERYFYYVDESSHVHAIDRDTGASIWKQEQLAYRRLGSPAVVGKFVVVGDFEGYLHFFDRDDGAIAARHSTDGGPISAAPLPVGPGNLLVQTRKGSLYAINVR